MFIVFEGIDGSGKTTISNRVGERLRAGGLRVTHVREKGTFTSTPAQAMRELGRDAHNLMMTPTAELLLLAARDIQSLEEMVLPALGQVDVVIADRYLYTAELLATAGRGLPAALVGSILAPIAARARPDLAILVDVPPDLARARRRIAKLQAPTRRPPSRKGMAGGGLQIRLRQAYRDLAEREPERWLIVDNQDADLDDIVEAVSAAIATTVRKGVAAGLAAGRLRLPGPGAPLPRGLAGPAEARAALLAWIDRRSGREPELAAYFLAGYPGDDLGMRRRALADRAPVVIAHGLTGLDDVTSWRLRDLLVDRAPTAVARSLDGLATEDAYRWRHTLAGEVPEAVAASLGGLDDDDAWALREQLRAIVPDAVTASLAGVESVRADAERRAWLDEHRAVGPSTYAAARAGARMVAGRSDDLAWVIRKLVFDLAPVEAIAGMKGDDSPRAWRWRTRFAERAPRPVAYSLDHMTEPEAWQLRAALASSCREVFHAMVALDDPEAWALRERHAETWPSTVCKSLGALTMTPRGAGLVTRLLAGPPSVSLLRNAAKTFSEVAAARRPGGADAKLPRARPMQFTRACRKTSRRFSSGRRS